MLKRSLFVCALLMTAAVTPVRADDVNNRIDQLQEQIRQLTGQVEELTFQMKQMQAQKKLGSAEPATPPVLAAPATQQAAAAPAPVAPPAALPFKKKAAEPTIAAAASDDGTEQIGETPINPQTGQPQPQITGGPDPGSICSRGTTANAAEYPGRFGPQAARHEHDQNRPQQADGGFQGKVSGPRPAAVIRRQRLKISRLRIQTLRLRLNPLLCRRIRRMNLYMRANQALLQRRFR